ncbi:MAG: DUF1592 domain-containing protein [Akkermansiaceae bacterium]|nr:DUF1592 domain-containing protein [Akkermansiaceae bacterium]NNM28201.1 DUF1592 domain-containing protein [Akkermansiaceae bacterium]
MRAIFALLSIVLPAVLPSCREAPAPQTGAALYAQQCAACHGANGEGVADEYDEPLWGSESPAALARYIHKSMPEGDETAVVDDEAALVAAYIHDAFYSPEARARRRPPRVELTRLTNNQFRQSLVDLIGSFYRVPDITRRGGLSARYFNSEKMAKQKTHVLDRVDPAVDFDFGTGSPAPGVTQKAFSITWSGSILAPESGHYQFRLRTRNGATLHLNSVAGEGGGSWSEGAFIDAYVSSNNEVRERTGRMFLLGGRAYPLHLEFFSYQEERSLIRLEWKPPHGTWSPVPPEQLSPDRGAPLAVISTPFPPDDRSLGYERGSSISGQWHEAATTGAVEAVNLIVKHLGQLVGEDGRDDPEKLKSFCFTFADRAFRRPLDAGQRRFFVARHFEDSPPEAALRKSLLLTLTSPRFLYPGLCENDGPPDHHTVAARLALGLWDSLPDDSLREAAARGRLGDIEKVRNYAGHMMRDPRTRQKVREFFHHWLAMDEREDLGKDPDLFPGFDPLVIADLRTSLERFIEDVVWSEASDYRELLRADYLFLNDRLAGFYEAPPLPEAGFVKVTLPGEPRAGVLTHPFLLSANAYHDNTSPIHRGVFLSQNILGRLLKPPPEAIAFKNDDFDPSLTMREKVTELTREESCMQCHAVINPIGFSLENFDAVGRFRTEENRKPLNTVSDYVTGDDRAVRLASARDLAALAIESPSAHRALVSHLFHHLIKQSPEAYAPGTVDSLREKFVESGYNMRELIVEVVVRASLHPRAGARTAAAAPNP